MKTHKDKLRNVWNETIKIINNHEDVNVRKRAERLLSQYNTAGGMIIRNELINFLDSVK